METTNNFQAPQKESSSGANTVLLVVIILLLCGAGYWWYQNRKAPATQNPGIDVNVTLPTPEEKPN